MNLALGMGLNKMRLGALLNQATAPGISGIATSLVGDTGFTIEATVNPGGAETTVSIEYGLTAAYGSTQAVVSGSPLTSTGAISAALTGLSQNTLYHYRVKAVNSEGTTYSADATQTTTNVRWIIPITGRTSGTATAGTMVITMTEQETLSVTGDVTQSTAITPDGDRRRHTVTVNCPNNGSGTLIIPDRSKVISLGSHQGAADPTVNFYTGTNATAPILSLNINDIPATTQKIRQSTAYDNILPATGSSALPTGLTYLSLSGNSINWTYAGALPIGLTTLSLSGGSISWTYTEALPTGLTYLYLNGNSIAWTYTGALPTGLTYLYLNGNSIAWTYTGALPTGLTFLYLYGNSIAWTYTGVLPTGLTTLYLSGNSIAWTYTGALPTGLTFLYLNGNSIAWTYTGALPTGLTYLSVSGNSIAWTGLDVGNSGNISTLSLLNYRVTKMSSTDMVTLLTQLTNRTGSLPATITINDYADWASPPTSVTNAVAALKAAKPNITTVNLGA